MGTESEHMDYLKQYVQQHPDNQMAWYLLGKAYITAGKEAKANYCFLQAGKIYEAYELKRHPLADKEPQHIIESWNRKRRAKSMMRRAALLLILLLGTFVSVPSNDQKDRARDKESGTTAENGLAKEPAGEQTMEAAVPSDDDYRMVFTTPDMANPLSESIALLMNHKKGEYAGKGLIVALENRQGWREWTGSTKLLLAMQKLPNKSAFQLQMLDSGACRCEPEDGTTAKKAWESWHGLQEERWTLASAIHQYKELFKRWPASLDELTGSYPNNVIAGEGPRMKALFPQLLAAVKAKAAAAGNGKPGGGSNEKTAGYLNGQAIHLPAEPLSIIVDTQKHRLSVITGDVIVRSYPVGLGGERTPEGDFYISEKVKNPNGKDNGEFGSRGMTLSGTLYAIHGTNRPDSIGADESLGCIRMGREDVEELYDLVPLGTKVKIQSGGLPDQPGKQPEKRFKLQPLQDETNPGVIYKWLG